MIRGVKSSIVLLMMVMGIILAVGFLLIISVLYHRSGDTAVADSLQAPLPNVVQVEGQPITLHVPVSQQPFVIYAPPPVTEIQPTQPPPEMVEPLVEATAVPQSTPADIPLALGGQPADHVMFISYIVQPGDTLYRIQANHITSIALMAKHGIDAEDIVVGNVLNLPVGNPAACTPWRPYVLLRGDTAFGLSSYFGLTLAELQARNGLDANYSLYETQVICVP